ncbi:hyaluronan mediated motility receptor [Cephus cinctus]|uniref:Hyaluronan mediated motility receptor n=1 Tax=Cephus cinctus TaxID=211228 RepID=A0AAJ7BWI6_CEPCN|nr:hyaluronan mediated motility receptor [Cephus cinctus]
MSFSKARIQRFNEQSSEAPPPGAYDPKFANKIKGFVIEKSERFQDTKSASSSGAECNLSVSSKGAAGVGSVATFRTPQLPRKRILVARPGNTSCPKSRTKSAVVTKDSRAKYDSRNELADLKVECLNKDKTIHENEKHIEELNDEIRTIEMEVEDLRKKQVEAEAQYKNHIEAMAKLQQDVLHAQDQRHKSELQAIRAELTKTLEMKEHEIEERRLIEKGLHERLEVMSKEVARLKTELNGSKEKEEMIEKLRNLKVQAEMREATLFEDLKESEDRKERAFADFEQYKITKDKELADLEERANIMVRDARSALEEEMRLSTERYEACVARMEAERVSLEAKLIHRDAENEKLSATLEELKASAETQESFSQSLQAELDRAEAELAERKEELRILKDQIRTEAAEMVGRRRRFDVIMAENQASVAALSRRLAQSDAEVERLQRELECGEACIYEHRDLLSAMRNSSKLVHEQMHDLIVQLDAKRELIDQLEAGSVAEFETLKSLFGAKIESLKLVAANEMSRLQDDCAKEVVRSNELRQQLDEMAGKMSEAREALLKLEEQHDVREIEISKLQLAKQRLEQQLDNAHGVTENLGQLEEERARREMAELEVKKLTDSWQRLNNDHKELMEKYTEILGHHNHNQKIKHISQLKEKIHRLEKDLEAKTNLAEHQQKLIDKFKSEEKRCVVVKGKENIQISKRTTPVSSPHKPATPLRARNE